VFLWRYLHFEKSLRLLTQSVRGNDRQGGKDNWYLSESVHRCHLNNKDINDRT